MPKPGEIRYCPELGGQETNAAFVWIPPGSFWMGDKSDAKNPVCFVAISKGFWLQQTPLTKKQHYRLRYSDLPTSLTWNDVVDFCRNKPLRMPTEAEWEYAARANTGHKYIFSGSNLVGNVAWTKNNVDNQSHKVGQLKSNSLGLFDLSGNVTEWCSDWYEEEQSPTPQINPTGPASGTDRVLRGGSWVLDLQYAQVSKRFCRVPDFRTLGHGVRLVWDPQHA